jgi:hypothetical protein
MFYCVSFILFGWRKFLFVSTGADLCDNSGFSSWGTWSLVFCFWFLVFGTLGPCEGKRWCGLVRPGGLQLLRNSGKSGRGSWLEGKARAWVWPQLGSDWIAHENMHWGHFRLWTQRFTVVGFLFLQIVWWSELCSLRPKLLDTFDKNKNTKEFV